MTITFEGLFAPLAARLVLEGPEGAERRRVGDVEDVRVNGEWVGEALRRRGVTYLRRRNLVGTEQAIGELFIADRPYPVYATRSGWLFCAPSRRYHVTWPFEDSFGQSVGRWMVAAASAIVRAWAGQPDPPRPRSKRSGTCYECQALRWLRSSDPVMGDAVSDRPSWGTGLWRTHGMVTPRVVCALLGSVVPDEQVACAGINARLVRGEDRVPQRFALTDIGSNCPCFVGRGEFPTVQAIRRGSEIVARIPGYEVRLRVA